MASEREAASLLSNHPAIPARTGSVRRMKIEASFRSASLFLFYKKSRPIPTTLDG
jgi:hypothetical protein